jgi:mono/diheme cytochrome c family protein
MKNLIKTLTLLAALLIAAISIVPVFANDDDDDDDDGEHGGGRAAYVVKANPLYTQECSSCHFLFPPGLLTAPSWEAVMRGQADHFGDNLALDQQSVSGILAFLKANSAERTNTEWGRKIANSSGTTAYLKITEIPWIMKEHRKIKAEVFKRPSIGSRSNCVACHRNAVRGDFDEDTVNIPKQ